MTLFFLCVVLSGLWRLRRRSLQLWTLQSKTMLVSSLAAALTWVELLWTLRISKIFTILWWHGMMALNCISNSNKYTCWVPLHNWNEALYMHCTISLPLCVWVCGCVHVFSFLSFVSAVTVDEWSFVLSVFVTLEIKSQLHKHCSKFR